MKLKKKSGLISAVIALSAASLVSVGFASWVISQGDSETVSGQISVDTVTDDRFNIVLGSGQTSNILDTKIVFGHAAYNETLAAVPSYNWLSNNNKLRGANDVSSAEVLVASFEFTITRGQSATPVAASTSGASVNLTDTDYKVTAALTDTGTDSYTTAIGGVDDVLGDLPTPVISYADNKFTCTVTFSWGEHFKVNGTITNPITYYNSKNPETNAGIMEEAYTVLNALSSKQFAYEIELTVAHQ